MLHTDELLPLLGGCTFDMVDEDMNQKQVENEIGLSLLDVLKHAGDQYRLEETIALYSTADSLSPKVLVEIGANKGTSSTILGLVAKKHNGMLYSIERRPLTEWLINMERFGISAFTRLLNGVSPHFDKEKLPFNSIDYLLIDADHRYQNVLADYLFWQTMVRPGGFIAFHDYFAYLDEVKKAVDEIVMVNGLELVTISDGTTTSTGTGHKLGLIVLRK